MIIKIDYRESDLHMLCVTMNKYTTPIKIVSENIPIGDIIICEDNGKERIMIERKSLSDLASSICDGRYKEQSFRLNQCSIHNHNIYYMIEGQLKSYKSFSRIDKRALLSSMVSISHFKGFSVHKTNDMQESAEWILQFADKLGREMGEKPFYSNVVEKKEEHDEEESAVVAAAEEPNANEVEANEVAAEQNGAEPLYTNGVKGSEPLYTIGVKGAEPLLYSLHMKRVKKNNITPENIGEIMLSQIPNVSVPTAISIMKQYKTISSLITSLQNDEHCLDTIKNESGKERKINKTSISSIIKYLLHK
jgi:ERCC4-type nuclease